MKLARTLETGRSEDERSEGAAGERPRDGGEFAALVEMFCSNLANRLRTSVPMAGMGEEVMVLMS